MSDSAPAITDALIGKIIDEKYRIVSLLGVGGMGSVYKAEHQVMQRIVAIKVMNAEASQDPTSIKRFHAEASALQRLNHPNVLKVWEFGVINGSPYLVLEYLEGKSLSDFIDERGALSLKECKVIFEELLAGLGHAHSRGLLHRDIKPNNVILLDTWEGTEISASVRIKIVDFGLAKLMESTKSQKLTTTGAFLGTPMYMSPEQFEGKQPNAQSDLYSAGCLMYECLTGKPPFQSDNFVELAMLHVNSPVPPMVVPTSSGKIPAGMERALQKALAKDPSDRYATAEEFAAVMAEVWQEPQSIPIPLRQVSNQPTQAKSPVQANSRKRLMVGVVIAAVSVLACMAAPFLVAAYERNLVGQARDSIQLAAPSDGDLADPNLPSLLPKRRAWYEQATHDLEKAISFAPGLASAEIESALNDIGETIAKRGQKKTTALDANLIRSYFSMAEKYWDSKDRSEQPDSKRKREIREGQWIAAGGLQLADFLNGERDFKLACQHLDRLMDLTQELDFWSSKAAFLDDGHFATAACATQLADRCFMKHDYPDANRYYVYAHKIIESDAEKSQWRLAAARVGLAKGLCSLDGDENFGKAQAAFKDALKTSTKIDKNDLGSTKEFCEGLADSTLTYGTFMNKWIGNHPEELYQTQLEVLNYLQPYLDAPLEKTPNSLYSKCLRVEYACAVAGYRAHHFKEAEVMLSRCFPALVQCMGPKAGSIDCAIWLSDVLRKEHQFDKSVAVADAGIALCDAASKLKTEPAEYIDVRVNGFKMVKQADHNHDAAMSVFGVE